MSDIIPLLLNDFIAVYQTGVETQHRIASFRDDILLVIKKKKLRKKKSTFLPIILL